MKRKNIFRSVVLAELLLIVPLIAMQFSDEWDWAVTDFIIVGFLLAGVGLGFEMVMVGLKKSPRLALIGLLITVIMVLTWMELAVGIFGTPFAGS